MIWITDGSGGSGLSEEEFGCWAVKTNAAITFTEYTLTFLVGMAVLMTFIADHFPALNSEVLHFQYRVFLAVALSILTGLAGQSWSEDGDSRLWSGGGDFGFANVNQQLLPRIFLR